MIIVRVWKDGQPCLGMARLRPLKGGQIDMSRFVNIGYVTSFDTKPQLEAMANFFGQALTQDFKGINSELMKEFKDQFVPIEPGSYVMTNITCTSGRNKSWIGDDRANPFASESGSATPILGANVIDVRPGGILDAGIIEIRSDDVGLFERKTGAVAASPAPAQEQAKLREMFPDAGKKLRFSSFRAGKR
ncbi:hypothetical protein [Microvirga arabica]|uniref:hypothetical protein n=1 Tax=Microvirga arabica TaxID=1128671 RepID=UPI001939875A|nr:hypothetical protein [Microvirga arabica]MBM1173341.1 hypothetical protein [Microvirga arabica]